MAQCKIGPSFGAPGLLILDAWVLPRSWVKPILGYEIKVSRSDFLQDKKWRGYLDWCHKFAFVVPWGMVKKEEVPEEAGLMWTTQNGRGLRWVKHAPNRRVEIPSEIFHYVLMWRAKFDGSIPAREIEPSQLSLFEEVQEA